MAMTTAPESRAPKTGLQPNRNLHWDFFSRCERTDLLPSASAAKSKWGAAAALQHPTKIKLARQTGRGQTFPIRYALALTGAGAI